MALIDLKTSLKSLKYGNDQPQYGSSNLPYVQTTIPDVINSAGTSNPIFRINSTGNLDYPIRGGQTKFKIGSSFYTASSELDKSRIQKFLQDKPRGSTFIEKQIGLQLCNPKMETGNSFNRVGSTNPLPGLLENTRIYNKGKNTLAQVGVQGTGVHAIRHGLLPFNPFQQNYAKTIDKQLITNNPDSNRLVNLYKLKIVNDSGTDINLLNSLGISKNKNLLFQYLGGPGSTYGIGSTTIKRANNTTLISSTLVDNYEGLVKKSEKLGNKGKTNNFNINPDLKKKGFPVDSYYTSPYAGEGREDKLNKILPFLFNNNSNPWDQSNNDEVKDTIKFVFEAINNDNPTQSTAIFFRAFLSAGITDTNSAEYNSFKYMGRGEEFHTYQGFTRSISFSFKVAVESEAELSPLYTKVNALVSQVYPDYSVSNFMRAPLVRVTIGDYLHRVPGFLKSVDITIDNETSWEITEGKQLPHIMTIAVSFLPILDILPKRVTPGVDTKLIANKYVGNTSISKDVKLTPIEVEKRIASNKLVLEKLSKAKNKPLFAQNKSRTSIFPSFKTNSSEPG